MRNEVYSTVKVKVRIDDPREYKLQAIKMKETMRDEPGTLIYDFFIKEERREVFQ